ncbi:carbohydrate ABC transporter substrate-binding protein, CUT1 family [Oceanobacillus limi]|uniref:Carbohydrate ABC transporter substrate-binding protein, CUT1 family n=1 Tax=Oceanobacillus limi TaxID=930131 RepID=A0A1I0B179_9BACI|nr:extracellular solute-binding protein [Oceanobacillus limi]SET00473.1 carbohydrate ABC transporter substrate-binding protein, CUT1 family [Oceanobacillus limi]
MKFRKSLLFLVAITVVLVLAACGGEDNEGNENSEGSEASSGEKITIFQSKVEISEQLEELAAEYEEETGVEVEVWGTTGDDYFQQLQIRLNSNQGPSIFSVRHITEAEKLDSYLYDMSNEPFVEHIAPDMALEYDGKVVGVPYGVEGFGLVYNKDLVSEEDIADYESFINTLEEFNGTDVDGLSLAQEAYFLIGHLSNYPFSLQDDNYEYIQQLNNGDVTMADTEEFQAFGQLMEDLRANIPNPLDITYDEQVGDFATGKTAMIHQGNWAYGMFEDYDLDFEIGMAPLPLLDNDKLEVGVGSNWGINGEKDDAEVQAAADFLNWMHTSETGMRYIVEEFGAVPAFTNIEANDLDPLSQAVLDATNSGETIPWSHNYYPANVIVNDFVPATENFFLSEDVSGDDFIDSLDTAWQNATK